MTEPAAASAPHILCVNPWIHDFAAFDFWAKPLGLLSLAAILRDHGVRVSFLDCLDRFHPQDPDRGGRTKKDGRGPFRKTPLPLPTSLSGIRRQFSRYGIDPDWFRRDLARIPQPDLILVTSMMTYWASGVRETIQVIKEIHPGVPVVLGGVYATLMAHHARDTMGADDVITGPGETRLMDILETYTGYGLTLRYDVTDPDQVPFPALDLVTHLPYAPILTSWGCPFSCAYCASSVLQPVFRQRSPDRVFWEIRHWHEGHHVRNFAFYDDALLVNPGEHILPLLDRIIASNMPLTFHTPNALHIRHITDEIAQKMCLAGFHTIRLGLETTDFSRSRTLDHKVTGSEFDRAVNCLKRAGFSSDQIGAYLLCGLPGQDFEAVAASIRHVRRAGIRPVPAYYTPIPRTPLWETAKAHSRFELETDPLYTNNVLLPCVRPPHGEADIARIKELARAPLTGEDPAC